MEPDCLRIAEKRWQDIQVLRHQMLNVDREMTSMPRPDGVGFPNPGSSAQVDPQLAASYGSSSPVSANLAHRLSV
jgi:hypothetical protein